MMSQNCSELIDSLSKVESVDNVHDLCTRLCNIYGFDGFIYAVRIPSSFVNPHVFVLSGYPDNWREHYEENGYANIDPTVRYCALNSLPLIWDRIAPLEKIDDTVRNFMDMSRLFGLRKGVSIPVVGLQGERAMVSFYSEKADIATSIRIETMLPTLHHIAYHLHEAIRRVVNTFEIYSARIHLTARERECLLWTAEGKTSWETSIILGISERTVIFHLQNAGEKLQVSNRMQAVARAISLGLVNPGL
jgi:DNA-binding CsgD family transcriptional regulator